MPVGTSDLSFGAASTKRTAFGGRGRGGGGGTPSDWNEGRDALVQFLNDLQTLLKFLVNQRIPLESRVQFQNGLNAATVQINAAITQLQQAQTEAHPVAAKLQEVGLRGDSGKLKLREFYEAIKTSPLKAVLKFANIILGSLAKAIPVLELVQEYKETVETKLENGPDAEIISLNIWRTEQWWNK